MSGGRKDIYSFIRMLATNHMVSMNVSATMNHPSTKKVSSNALFSTMDSFGLIRSGITYRFIGGLHHPLLCPGTIDLLLASGWLGPSMN